MCDRSWSIISRVYYDWLTAYAVPNARGCVCTSCIVKINSQTILCISVS